jgi:hypothetical protein
VAANGTLYFAGEREGGKGGNDLFRALLVNGKYEQVERLDELNTPCETRDYSVFWRCRCAFPSAPGLRRRT